MPWSGGMPKKLITVPLSSMTLSTTDRSMPITRISQTPTGAPFMTQSMCLFSLCNVNQIQY